MKNRIILPLLVIVLTISLFSEGSAQVTPNVRTNVQQVQPNLPDYAADYFKKIDVSYGVNVNQQVSRPHENSRMTIHNYSVTTMDSRGNPTVNNFSETRTTMGSQTISNIYSTDVGNRRSPQPQRSLLPISKRD